ncbi:MAG: AMP-binding protein [Alphaproteobacteria bacterium]
MTTIAEALRSSAHRRPDHLAYAYDKLEHSWAEVDRRVDRLANALCAIGIGKGDVIASCCHDGPVLNEVLFAAARIGAIRVGLNYRYSAKEFAQVVQHCGAKLVFLQRDFAALAADLPKHVRTVDAGDAQSDMAAYEALLQSGAATPPDAQVAENDVAQICYTTGSTGEPKAAVWTHRNYMHSTCHTLLDLGMERNDTWLHCLPGAGVPCVLDTWNAVLGFTNVIMKAFEPKSCLTLIQKYKVTRTVWVPTMLLGVCTVAEQSKFDLSSVRRISYGSAPTTTALIRRALRTFAGVKFDQWYGSTEGAGGWYTQLTPEDHDRALAGAEHLLQSCGKPMHHAEIKIVRADGSICPPGEVGEVCVRGQFVMKEYFRNPDLTAETLRGGWLHTGDMGKLDDEGYVFLVDRKQFMIITGGYNVYPVDVENALAAHPAVAEVCVFGVPDEKWGEAVHALVVLRPGQSATQDEIVKWCRKDLAAFKVPKSIEFRDALMRGPTGKVLKRAHKEEYWKHAER